MHRGRRLLACPALGLSAPSVARAGEPCPDGQIRVESGCATLEAAAEGARVIVAQTFADEGMSAAILRVSVGGRPLVTEAWGSSMTGVPATPDMHFRAGAVAIAYLGTVLLQLQERGVLSIEDRLSKWFPDFPGADEVLNDTRSSDIAVIQPPVLHSYSDERGLFEDATYWSPSWTLARGAIMTTDIYDLERSAVAVGSRGGADRGVARCYDRAAQRRARPADDRALLRARRGG